MRALNKTLDAIDTAGMVAGEPELAMLVVRESDQVPGQGWWVGSALPWVMTGCGQVRRRWSSSAGSRSTHSTAGPAEKRGAADRRRVS
jgi:hypothetical protein